MYVICNLSILGWASAAVRSLFVHSPVMRTLRWAPSGGHNKLATHFSQVPLRSPSPASHRRCPHARFTSPVPVREALILPNKCLFIEVLHIISIIYLFIYLCVLRENSGSEKKGIETWRWTLIVGIFLFKPEKVVRMFHQWTWSTRNTTEYSEYAYKNVMGHISITVNKQIFPWTRATGPAVSSRVTWRHFATRLPYKSASSIALNFQW